MDNDNAGAPVIPQGTKVTGGAAYDPLRAAQSFGKEGQASSSPDANKPVAQQGNDQSTNAAEKAITFDDLAKLKGFKTPDDLARSYSELEGKNTRVEMSLSEIIRLREQAIGSQPAPVDLTNVQTNEDAMKVLERMIDKHTRPLKDTIELQNLISIYPDAKNYLAQIAEIVKTSPGVQWKVAYDAARTQDLERNARSQGRQEAYSTIQQKQDVAAQPAKPTVRDGRSLDDIIRDRSIPFAEVQKIMRERLAA